VDVGVAWKLGDQPIGHSVSVVRKITKMHGTKNPGGWVIRTLHKGVFLYEDRHVEVCRSQGFLVKHKELGLKTPRKILK